jgi:hypothetical protein
MKTSMNHAISADRKPNLMLDWSDPVVSSRVGWLAIPNPAKSPVLRIFQAEKKDLFKCAIAASNASGIWETIVFTAMALSAVSALLVAFLAI